MTWETCYPRPQMRRSSFLPLMDGWKLNGLPICMPFPPESPLSGFEGEYSPTLHYETTFTLPEGFLPEGQELLLHLGAVDQVAEVFLNDRPVVRHEGGYLPFSACVTPCLRPGENVLTVIATDVLSHDFPYGKQRRKRGGMWYTPVSGVWQTIWLEAVPHEHIASLTLDADLTGVTVHVRGGAGPVSLQALDGETPVAACTGESDALRLEIPPERRRLWTPSDPHLYGLVIRRGEDEVRSYFALRTVEIRPDAKGVNRVCLNGEPVFLSGVLDQGYFHDGIYLPADPDEYDRDVLRMKELGFNLLRKHIKVEPERFYEACDRLGMLVMQDMVNSGGYNYFFDTVLPTVGLQRQWDRPGSRERRAFFEQHARDTVAHLRSHPCVIAWTIFNEGWGQYDTDRLYRELKALDPTRLWDAASGWFIPKESDFDSPHVYFRNKRLKPGVRPMLLSECGGYARPIPGHLWNPAASYGYGKTGTEEQLTSAIDALLREMVNPAVARGLCGFVYTQLSDVEDEINGLYTYNRQVCKVDKARLKELLQIPARLLREAAAPSVPADR